MLNNNKLLPPKLNAIERSEVMVRTEGFLPTTYQELHEAVGLRSWQEEVGQTGRHLNEILLHQKKADTTDPQQAVRSVVAEYASYAMQSHVDVSLLNDLKDRVSEMMNPKMNLGEELEHSKHTNLATARLVRFMDLSQYARDADTGNLGFNPLSYAVRLRGSRGGRKIVDRYSVDPIDPYLALRVGAIVASTSVKDARSLVKYAVVDQNNRLTFWTNRLRESRSHALARPIAERALKKLQG